VDVKAAQEWDGPRAMVAASDGTNSKSAKQRNCTIERDSFGSQNETPVIFRFLNDCSFTLLHTSRILFLRVEKKKKQKHMTTWRIKIK
jgi:hypothetical protein